MNRSLLSSRKVLLTAAMILLIVLSLFAGVDLDSDAASGRLYLHQGGIVPGTYVICGPSIQANGDSASYSYCISSEVAYGDGLKHVKLPESNPPDTLLWTIAPAEDGKYIIYSVAAKKYLTLAGSRIILSENPQGLYIKAEGNYFHIYLDTSHYLRFTNVDPGSRWHCGVYARNFQFYSTERGFDTYDESDTPLLTVACFSDMHHEYGIQYTTTATRGSSARAYSYAKSVTNKGRGADVVLIGGDISGRRNTSTGGSTWDNAGYNDDGSTIIRQMMDKNYAAFQTASKDGKVLIVTGNHDPEPSVHMTPKGDSTYPAVNSNDWTSYMTAACGAPTVSVTYSDLGLSTSGVPSQYRNEVLGYVYQIKGMYFLGLNTPFGDRHSVSEVGHNGLYVEQVNWAAKQLANIGKDKTVLFLCHYPLNGMPTVTGPKTKVNSAADSPAPAAMKKLLAEYPNVIYTYGHHHAGDAQILHYWAGEKVVPLNGSTRLKNNAYLASGWLNTYMGSLGYYSYSYQPSLTSEDIQVVQFLTIEFYANHITFNYHNSGVKAGPDGEMKIVSYTVARDLSNQFGVASVPFDTTLYGQSGSADTNTNTNTNSNSGTSDSAQTGDNSLGPADSNAGTPSDGGNSSGSTYTDNGGNVTDLPDGGYTDDTPTFVPPVVDTEVNATKPEENALSANLGGTADQLKNATLEDYELQWAADGDTVSIWLETKDAADLPAADKAPLQSAAEGKTVAAWLSLDLFTQMEGEKPTQVKAAKEKITVSLIVPEEFRNTDPTRIRTYTVLQKDGALETQYDAASGMLTFETADFTLCALAYADADAPVASDSDTGSGTGSDVQTGTVTDTPVSSVTDGGSEPAGPSAGMIVALVAGGVILLGAGAALACFLLRKKSVPKA